jgi:TetR/AcrR family transcriptional regulator, transcriptional repressor for nem operon
MPVTKIHKEEILHRCWEVLHLRGYNGASISMLADAAGLGKAGLLHHFGSKEALMKAVLLYAAEQFRGYVLSVAHEDLPPEQRLEKLLRRQNRVAKLERKGCFFANTALEMGSEGFFNEFLVSFFDEWQTVVSGLFATAMPESEARAAAYRLLLEYEGSVTLFKISGDTRHLENLVQRAVDQFLTARRLSPSHPLTLSHL